MAGLSQLQRVLGLKLLFNVLSAVVMTVGLAAWADTNSDQAVLDFPTTPESTSPKVEPLSFEAQDAIEALLNATHEAFPGARRWLKGAAPIYLTPQEVEQQVRRNNPSLMQSRQQVQLAKHEVELADAAFSPWLSFSMAWSRANSRERAAMITRTREVVVKEGDWLGNNGSGENVFQWWYAHNDLSLDANSDGTVSTQEVEASYQAYLAANGQKDIRDLNKKLGIESWSQVNPKNEDDADRIGQTLQNSGLLGTCVMVDGESIGGDCQFPTETTTKLEYASGWSSWSDAVSASVGVAKPFAWGGNLSTSLKSSYQQYNPSKSASVGMATALELGESEWSSSLGANFAVPTPFSSGVGLLGNRSAVDGLIKRHDQIKTQWLYRMRENQTVRSALDAYWDVVGGLLAIHGAMEQQRVYQAHRLRTVHRYLLDQATAYDRDQAESRRYQGDLAVEEAWATLLVRVNRLVELLDLEPGKLPIPKDFMEQLMGVYQEPVTLDGGEIIHVALKNRPEIKAAQELIGADELEVHYRNQQLRPDIQLNFSLNTGQSTAIYGFNNLGDSLAHVVEPDSLNYYAGVTMSFPWGKRKAKADLSQSRATLQQAWDASEQAELEVRKDVNHALATLESRRKQVEIAAQALELAGETLESANRRYDAGRLSGFEVFEAISQYHQAWTRFQAAMIERQKADIQLSAAQGLFVAQWEDDRVVGN